MRGASPRGDKGQFCVSLNGKEKEIIVKSLEEEEVLGAEKRIFQSALFEPLSPQLRQLRAVDLIRQTVD